MRIRIAITAAAALAAGAVAASPAAADRTGNYIVTDDTTTNAFVYNFTPAGARTTITQDVNLTNPEGLVRVAADDYLVADRGPTTGALADGRIVRIRNGVQSLLSSAGNLVNPHAIALSADRRFAFVAGRDGAIVEVALATGAQRLVAALAPADLRAIAVERTGSLLVTDSSIPTRLLRVPATGGGAPGVLYTGQVPASDLRSVLVLQNNSLVLGDSGSPNPASGGVYTGRPNGPFTAIASGPFFANNSVPGALALDAGGNVIVADRNDTSPAGGPGRIYKISFSGVVTPIVSEVSGLLSEPGGIAVVPPKCRGKFATIVGTPRKDTLPGTNGPDVIVALGGRDVVKARGGKDLICGGAGPDRLIGGGGKDRIIGGKGKDIEKP